MFQQSTRHPVEIIFINLKFLLVFFNIIQQFFDWYFIKVKKDED